MGRPMLTPCQPNLRRDLLSVHKTSGGAATTFSEQALVFTALYTRSPGNAGAFLLDDRKLETQCRPVVQSDPDMIAVEAPPDGSN
jgi:hypothetical protein